MHETTPTSRKAAASSSDHAGSSTYSDTKPPPVYATPSAFRSPTKLLARLKALDDAMPPREVVGPSQHIYRGTSLFCLRPADPPRRQCIHLIESMYFDSIILTAIICNCMTMAWESPLDPTGTWKASFIDVRVEACALSHRALCDCEYGSHVLAADLRHQRDHPTSRMPPTRE